MSLLSVVGAVLFAAGAAAGWWLCRDREARGRAEWLERELEDEQLRHEAYQQEVEKHFAQTSDLFRDLTQQYTALYGHLAEGARELCSTQVPALASGHDFPALAGPPNASAARTREPRTPQA